MRFSLTSIFVLFLLIATTSVAAPLRIASYNVKYLNACVNYVRENSLRETLSLLNADVIAIQEVKDRRALEYFFDPSDWHIVIDDESTDDQNLAFVVRRGVEFRLASGNASNADEGDFLFPHSSNFPDKRDVLRLMVYVPELNSGLEILNHHAKSRYNGRVTSETQRLGAAKEIAAYINQTPYPYVIVLGDFNDNPDDSSLNTIESGYEVARGMENTPGQVMVNLAEPLLLHDYVTYGLNTRSISDGIVSPVISGSRLENYAGYDDDYEVRKALYDQILVSLPLAQVANKTEMSLLLVPSATQGNDDTRSSDHIPVFVDLFAADESANGLKVSRVLPNPVGQDNDNEIVEIKSTLSFTFIGKLVLEDKANNIYTFEIVIPPQGTAQIVPAKTAFSLNNSDELIRLYVDGVLADEAVYEVTQEGEWVKFDN